MPYIPYIVYNIPKVVLIADYNNLPGLPGCKAVVIPDGMMDARAQPSLISGNNASVSFHLLLQLQICSVSSV